MYVQLLELANLNTISDSVFKEEKKKEKDVSNFSSLFSHSFSKLCYIHYEMNVSELNSEQTNCHTHTYIYVYVKLR